MLCLTHHVQVLFGDYGTDFRPADLPMEHVGYCPQVNPLWPRITLQEHLEVYAAVKGLRGHDVPGIIKRWVFRASAPLLQLSSTLFYKTPIHNRGSAKSHDDNRF